MRNSALFFAICSVLLIACKNNQNENQVKTDQPISVEVLPVEHSLSKNNLSISGNVDGNKMVRIGFMVAGRISNIPVEEGSFVKKGQAVAALDPINYDIARDVANVQMQQANDEYNRLKIMHDRNSISDADFQKVTFVRQQAQQQLRLHNQNLTETRIYAPFSGIVLKKLAEKGEIISQGMPVMVIADISQINVNAYIPENELKNIKIGQNAEVFISAIDQKMQGRITEVGGAADPTTRTFTVKIKVPNPQNKIRPGMIAEINIASPNSTSAIYVPANAILQGENNQKYVYIIDQSKGKAFRRNVSIGGIADNQIEIIAGLNNGDKIVIAGQNNLSNGSSVNIKN